MRTFEENVRHLKNIKSVLAVWDPEQPPEQRQAAMRPVMRQIREEFLERQATERVQDFSSDEFSDS